MSNNFIKSTPKGRKIATLLLAHGAGAPMDSDWMNALSELLVERNIEVIRFNFPYMQKRKLENKKYPPDRIIKLIPFWLEVIKNHKNHSPLFIAGKSMGGRIAAHVLEESNAKALIAYGFPFHPSGKPEKLRLEAFENTKKPMLVLQGERDALGSKEECLSYQLKNNIQFKWLTDGDHSFKPRKASGKSLDDNMLSAANYTLQFIKKHL